MKVIAVIFVLALAAVNAKPAPKQGDDVEVVPLEKNYSQGKYPVIDVPAGGPGVGSVGLDDDDDISGLGVGGHGLDNVFEQMERMMARMREQMSHFWRGSASGAVDTEDVDDFATGGINFPRFPQIDLSKAKNTSVTKDINGHKVLVNETDYEDKTGNSFVKVHFVNIAPAGGFQGTEKTITSTSNAPRDVEPIESQENEIPKGKTPEVGSVVPEKVQQEPAW